MSEEAKVTKAIEIFDAKISFMSLVDKPANLRPFLITKAEDGGANFQTYGRIIKVDDDTHYITGIAYEPMVEDAHGNFMTEDEIRKAAYWFAKNGDKVDIQHSFEKADGLTVVENWVAKSEMPVGDETVTKGTWLVTVEVTDPDIWNAVQKGDITGFSIGGVGKYSEENIDLADETSVAKEENQMPEIEKAAVAEITPEQNEGSLSLLQKLAKSIGLEVVAKGEVLDDFNDRQVSSGFWNAIYAFQNAVMREYYDYRTDRWRANIESDADKINEALSDLKTALEGVFASPNIVKAITATAPKFVEAEPVEKAGKKMSTCNKKKLTDICQSLTEFCKEFDEDDDEKDNPEDEDKDVTKSEEPTTIIKEEEPMNEEVKKCIEETVAKAVADAMAAQAPAPAEPVAEPAPVEKAETPALTIEAVQSAIEKAVADATAEPAPVEKAEAPLTMEAIQKVLDERVEEIRKSRGLPTNLNEEPVKKEESDCPLHGLLF